MEWVETTGKTLEAALDRALDQLGVDEPDVEYEVLAEPRPGLFGRLRGEARVRARVKPLSREKPGEQRGRRGDARRGRSRNGGNGARGGRGGRGSSSQGKAQDRPASGGRSRSRSRRRRGSGSGSGQRRPQERRESTEETRTTVDEQREVAVEEQADLAMEFAQGLVDAFGADAEVVSSIEDDENVLVEVTGDDLGLLVGPKGSTLAAVEELVRTVVQRNTAGGSARIHVDVGGYRAKRRAALAEFVGEVAETVLDSGDDRALEPMSAADRKVVHDTVAEIEGVTTTSEGEEPRRRVVISPD